MKLTVYDQKLAFHQKLNEFNLIMALINLNNINVVIQLFYV